MRILHVIPYVSPIFGGPPQVVAAMLKALIEKDHEVIIFSTTEGLSGKIGGAVSVETFNDSRYRLFPTSHLKKWFYSKLLIQELKKLEDSIDLVHLHIPFTATFLFTAKWAKKNKIPYVITTHGLLDRWSMDQKKIRKWLYYFFIEKHTIKHALKIHVTSLFEKNEIERLGLCVPLEVIPLPIINEKESRGPIPDERVSICDDEIPHLLFVGRLHPVKGILYLIKSLKISVTLRIIFSGLSVFNLLKNILFL
jgi:glycosyltransferase involved in cell wall biosynthesis